MSVRVSTTRVSPAAESGSTYTPELSLIRDLGSMREKGKQCDVTLISDSGKEFRVHSLVLEARSDVFGTMLASAMLEGRTHRIPVKAAGDKTVALFIG